MRPLLLSVRMPIGIALSGLGLLAACPAQAQSNYNYSSFYNVTSIDVSIPGGFSTALFGLNDSGQIAGSYMDANGVTNGFFGTPAVQTTVDGPAALSSTDNPFSEINKINNAGTYAGDFEASDSTGTDSTQGFTGSGGSAAPTTINNSLALGINNAGSTVGQVLSSDGTFNRSYLQSSTGAITVFDVPGYGTSQATGINDSGVIVGNAAADTLSSPSVGFVDTKNTFSFLNIPGAYDVFAEDISSSGVIVGGYDTPDSGAETGFVLMNGVLTSYMFPDSIFTEIDAVNSSGEIAGTYFDSFGAEHGFTADPVPEASTTVSLGLLIGLGGVLLTARRRQAPAAA